VKDMKVEVNYLKEALGLSFEEVMDRCNHRFSVEELEDDTDNPRQVIYVYA